MALQVFDDAYKNRGKRGVKKPHIYKLKSKWCCVVTPASGYAMHRLSVSALGTTPRDAYFNALCEAAR